MKCLIHNQADAVGTCGDCGSGLCPECVSNAHCIEGKPLCKNCWNAKLGDYIAALQTELAAHHKKRKIWSIIFGLGCAAFVFNLVFFLDFATGFFVAIFIWGAAGFFDRVKRSIENLQNETYFQAKTRYDLYQSGGIWHLWLFKLILWPIRGLFFPISYALFMVKGDKELVEAINSAEAERA